MRVLVARHAQTLANRDGFILGRRDSPLTGRGRAASADLAANIAYAGTGVICASPLARAATTAELFAAASGWPLLIVDTLAELSSGAWEGLPRSAVLPQGGPLRPTWTAAPPGGESCAAAEPRVQEALVTVTSLPYENVLVVGHAGVNHVLLRILLSLEPEQALAIRHPHNVVYTVEDGAVSWLRSGGMTGHGLLPHR